MKATFQHSICTSRPLLNTRGSKQFSKNVRTGFCKLQNFISLSVHTCMCVCSVCHVIWGCLHGKNDLFNIWSSIHRMNSTINSKPATLVLCQAAYWQVGILYMPSCTDTLSVCTNVCIRKPLIFITLWQGSRGKTKVVILQGEFTWTGCAGSESWGLWAQHTKYDGLYDQVIPGHHYVYSLYNDSLKISGLHNIRIISLRDG